MGLLRFTVKSSIAGGAVYYTIQEGIWSTPEESAQFYNKVYNFISPYFKRNIPPELVKEMQHIPNPSNFKVYAATYWNQGVSNSINFLINLPNHASNGINRIKQEIEKSSLNNELLSEKK